MSVVHLSVTVHFAAKAPGKLSAFELKPVVECIRSLLGDKFQRVVEKPTPSRKHWSADATSTPVQLSTPSSRSHPLLVGTGNCNAICHGCVVVPIQPNDPLILIREPQNASLVLDALVQDEIPSDLFFLARCNDLNHAIRVETLLQVPIGYIKRDEAPHRAPLFDNTFEI